MRVKSIKVKDHQIMDELAREKSSKNKENKLFNTLNNSKNTQNYNRNIINASMIHHNDTDLNKLSREKLIVYKKLQRNSIENAKKISFLNTQNNGVNTRLKSSVAQNNSEKIRVAEGSGKKPIIIETYRPRTVFPQSGKSLSFNETIDGYRIDVKNGGFIDNPLPHFNHYHYDNNSSINTSMHNKQRASNLKRNASTSSKMHDYDPDSITLRSLNFPNINNPRINTSLTFADSLASESPRREKLTSSRLARKESLKPKSAKLLFNEQNESPMIANTNDDVWYSNNYGKWMVDEETDRSTSRKEKSGKSHSFRVQINIPAPPSTTPTTQFYSIDKKRVTIDSNRGTSESEDAKFVPANDGDSNYKHLRTSFNINSTRPKTNNSTKSTTTAVTMTTMKTAKTGFKSPMLRTTKSGKMHIKDLIRYMKPTDNQQFDNEGSCYFNDSNYFNTEKQVNDFLHEQKLIMSQQINPSNYGPTNSLNFNDESKNNEFLLHANDNNTSICSKSADGNKPEKFELNIKIPLGNDVIA